MSDERAQSPAEIISNLRRTISYMQEAAERRNRQLDALHVVWCDGGCVGGVHRYDGHAEIITEELVAEAELNAKRLRTWFENRKHKLARRQQP